MLDLTEEQALQKLTAWCSTAEHCESEAISKLKLWSFDPDEVDRIMKKLKATAAPLSTTSSASRSGGNARSARRSP